MKLIQENLSAIIYQIPSGEFEIWIKMKYTTGYRKGSLICPRDEDFGVWAWTTYNMERAIKIYQEITDGIRTIRPMVEDANSKNEPAK